MHQIRPSVVDGSTSDTMYPPNLSELDSAEDEEDYDYIPDDFDMTGLPEGIEQEHVEFEDYDEEDCDCDALQQQQET